MTEYAKPLPDIDSDNKEFWNAAKEHRFLLYQCQGCKTFYYPDIECTRCEDLRPPMKWVDSSGRGKLFTWIVMHRKYHDGFADDVPYNVALVELEEGPFYLTNIVDCENDQLKQGMELDVTFEQVTDEIILPKFKPRGVAS